MAESKDYLGKRTPGATPEPFTSARRTGGVLFVVHRHAARRDHYDLRLEVDGALWSWAVPKGPCDDPAVKRLAVRTEDHPLDYGFFEGVIPEGHYGAGPSIAWDRGSHRMLVDPAEGIERGKLLFELAGHKLRGRWTLVRTRQDWLLIKERDAHAVDGGSDWPQDSILSGLTCEQLADPSLKIEPLLAEIERDGAERAAPPARPRPMLCEVGEPFDDPDWLFEIKYDGYRLLADKREGAVRLLSRGGNDLAANFPEIAEVVARLPLDPLLLDGEVVVHDAEGLPSFQRLQQRAQLSRQPDVERAALVLPATFYAFDLLQAGDWDLRALPLTARKRRLATLLPGAGAMRFADHVEERGQALFERAQAMGLEGLIAKRADSRYQHRRSPDWRKLPAWRREAFTVIGWREEKTGSGDIGALHLAERESGAWRYRGRVGSGLSEALRTHLASRFESAIKPPVAVDQTTAADHWLRPEVAVEVRYREITRDGHLRQPVLLGLAEEFSGTTGEPAPAQVREEPPSLKLTNLDKPYFPEAGFSKGDLLDYYRAIAPAMLPWLSDRPVVLVRYPDGIHGKSFYQHAAPGFAPDWIRRHPVTDEDGETTEYFVVDSVDALLYLANLGTIPFHIFAARVDAPEHPDWCSLDLDPKDAPFEDVIAIAREIHRLCESLGLPNFIKTTGQSGLHVLIPTGRALDQQRTRDLGELLARVVVRRLPDIATVERLTRRRRGKVYVDYLQNGAGKTLVAPFAARPVPAASVSMPLRWPQVRRGLDPARFTIASAPREFARHGDPWAGLTEATPDLLAVLDALSMEMADAVDGG